MPLKFYDELVNHDQLMMNYFVDTNTNHNILKTQYKE